MIFQQKAVGILKTNYPTNAAGYLAKEGDTAVGTKQVTIPFIKASSITADDENYWSELQAFNDRINNLFGIENDQLSNKLTLEYGTGEGE